MLWSRQRYLVFVAALVSLLPLGRMAYGGGALGDGLPRIRDFALARTPEQAEAVVGAWRAAGALGTAARAIEWDFAFIVAYVLFVALASMAVARRAPAPWDRVGPWAALAGVVAGAVDFAENVALLSMLERWTGGAARVAFLAAWLELALLAIAALLAALVVGAGLPFIRRSSAEPRLDWTIDPKPPEELLQCDLVMKGGITSGVVYPGAVFALAQRYRFMNIGGSSAGAIAAAIAAAAEYRRRATGTNDGFVALRDATASLAENDRLFRLFQPAPECAGLFDVFTSTLRPGRAVARIAWALWTAIAVFPLVTVTAIVVPLAIALGASAHLSPVSAAWTFILSALASALLAPIALAWTLYRTAANVLPRNGHGLCPGPTQGSSKSHALSDWLADVIDSVAFANPQEEGPLTLGHLWCGGTPDGERLARIARGEERRAINLEVLTTSLTHGRPYRIPFERVRLWFDVSDLKRVLPERVVNFMANAGQDVAADPRLPPLPKDVVALPRPESLPVVFLARMSLSFPFLLSAPRLMGLRFRGAPGHRGDDGPPDEERDDSAAPGAEPSPLRRGGRVGAYEDHWFSDGGISSNFPIHFFDQPLPSWPTFGLDLGSAPAGTPDSDRVRLAHQNGDGIMPPWLQISGMRGFGGALFSALHAWMDNMQKRAPGYRDRIVRVDLTPDEGGLNLAMPPERVLRLAKYGHDAGRKLGEWFDPGADPAPSGDAGAQAFRPWDNHRWVRFRSTVALLDRTLRNFATALNAAPPPGARTYEDMILESNGPAPSYRYRSKRLMKLAKGFADALAAAPAPGGRRLATRAPRPEPELRIVPKV